MPGAVGTDTADKDRVVNLVGTNANPARDPKKRPLDKGSIRDNALKDSIIVLAVCLAFLLFLMYSLRHHNV